MASPGTAAIALVNATLTYVRRIFCIPLAEAAASALGTASPSCLPPRSELQSGGGLK